MKDFLRSASRHRNGFIDPASYRYTLDEKKDLVDYRMEQQASISGITSPSRVPETAAFPPASLRPVAVFEQDDVGLHGRQDDGDQPERHGAP